MLTFVVYDSLYGNTEQIAQAIARGASAVGAVRVMSTADATGAFAERPDFVFLGGPTQRRGMSPGLKTFVEALPAKHLGGIQAAAYDTRLRMAMFLSGSAAKDAADRLRKSGANVVAQPESFFVESAKVPAGTKPLPGFAHLLAGELERAEGWGRTVASVALKGQAA